MVLSEFCHLSCWVMSALCGCHPSWFPVSKSQVHSACLFCKGSILLAKFVHERFSTDGAKDQPGSVNVCQICCDSGYDTLDLRRLAHCLPQQASLRHKQRAMLQCVAAPGSSQLTKFTSQTLQTKQSRSNLHNPLIGFLHTGPSIPLYSSLVLAIRQGL